MEEQEFEYCIRCIQSGKKEGLKQIYEAYVGLIYTVVFDIVKRKEDAQDITSEFFIRLWEKADTYRFGGKHKAWLMTIARNMTVDFLRKQKREFLVEDIGEQEQKSEDFTDSVVGELSFREAMEHLKVSEQEVLDMKIVGEMTFQEISQVLNKPMGTVTWLYRQAIQKLKKYHQKETEVQA